MGDGLTSGAAGAGVRVLPAVLLVLAGPVVAAIGSRAVAVAFAVLFLATGFVGVVVAVGRMAAFGVVFCTAGRFVRGAIRRAVGRTVRRTLAIVLGAALIVWVLAAVLPVLAGAVVVAAAIAGTVAAAGAVRVLTAVLAVLASAIVVRAAVGGTVLGAGHGQAGGKQDHQGDRDHETGFHRRQQMMGDT